MLVLIASLAASIFLSQFFDYTHDILLLGVIIYVLEAAAVYLRVRNSPYFLVKRSYAKLGWLMYVLYYLPYISTIGSDASFPFWVKTTLTTFTILALVAYWQIPSKLQEQAEAEYAMAD